MRRIGRYLLCYMLMAVLVLGNQDFFVWAAPQTEGAAQAEGVRAEQRQNTPYSGLMPSVGDVRVLVFLVDFPDLGKGKISKEKLEKELFHSAYGTDTAEYDGICLSEYYEVSSYGLLHMDGDVKGYYTAKKDSSYYAAKGNAGREELLHEVLSYYDAEINYADYDADKDGIIDGLYIDFLGEERYRTEVFWDTGTFWLRDSKDTAVYDDVEANGCVWLNRNRVNGWGPNTRYLNSFEDVIYVYETGFLLGLKNYDVNPLKYKLTGRLGTFDMMSNMLGDMNAFSKITLGWIEPTLVSKDTELTLRTSQLYPDAAILYPNGNVESDQYFVVEYVTNNGVNAWGYVGKQNVIYALDKGGLRVWRVNAALNEEGTDYRYTNESGVPFIESVGISDIGGLEKERTKNSRYVSNLYFQGDGWSPYTTPSSYIYADTAQQEGGPFTTSGISLKDILINSLSAKADITYENVEDTSFEYDLECWNDPYLIAELGFKYETAILDADKIYVKNERGTLAVSAEMKNIARYGYKKLYIYGDIGARAGSLILEEGALKNANGVMNPRIEIKIEAPGLSLNPTAVGKLSGVNDKSMALTMAALPNQHTYYIYGDTDGCLNFLDIYEENGKLTYGVTPLPLTYSKRSSAPVELAANDRELFFSVVREDGKSELYKMDTKGNYSLLYTVETGSLWGLKADNSRCIFYQNGSCKMIDLETNRIYGWKEFTTYDESGLRVGQLYENNIIVYNAANEITMLNADGEIIHQFKETIFLSNENICNILTKDDRIYIWSEVDKGVERDVMVTVLDGQLRLLKRVTVLQNTNLGQDYRVVELASGYALEFWNVRQQIAFFVGAESDVFSRHNELVILNEDFNVVSSTTKIGKEEYQLYRLGSVGNQSVYLQYIDGENAVNLSTIGGLDFSDIQKKEVIDLKLNKSTLELKPYSKYQLKAAINPYDASEEIIWTSSNEEVVTVGVNGLVRVVGNGEAVITAKAGDKTASCEVISCTYGKDHLYNSNSSLTWQWASDYSSVEATVGCAECGKKETVPGEVESGVTKASCTQDGLKKYTAKVQCHGTSYETTEITDEVVYPATGHHYEETWLWSTDWKGHYIAACASIECTAGDSIKNRWADIAVKEIPATCTVGGKTVYTAQTELDGIQYTDVKEVASVAAGHSYGVPTWNWSEDYTKAAATFRCTAGDDTQVKQADVTVKETPATCTTDGRTVYTAQTEVGGIQYTDIKEIVSTADGHSYGAPAWKWAEDYSAEAVFDCIKCGKKDAVQGEVESSVTEASCTQDGLRKYTAKVQWHGAAYETTEISNEVVYPATGHHYDVTWNWSGDYTKAAAIFQCTAGDDIQVRRVNVAVDETPATCTTDGKTVYTAQTEIGGIEYADKKEVVLTAAGHSYGAPIWNWSKDYTEATADFVCAAGDDRQTLQAEISSEIVEPTVTAEGRAAYTARVSFRGRTYSERKEVVLKKLEWPDDPVVAVLYGDVDGDGYITPDDALAVLQYIAGKNPPRFIKEAADCDRSGFITPDDALRILQYVAGKIREI